MDPFGEVVIGIAILVGLVGILIPVLPGLILVVVAVLIWAIVEGGTEAWTIAGVAFLLGAGGMAVSYLIPGRRLKNSGIPMSTLLLGGGLAIAGFFVIPVVGGPLGFVLGIYLAERQRLGHDAAWPATMASVRAVGLSIGIELAAGLLIAGVWLAGVIWL